ncbi:MAG: hypothetical protein N2440_05610 [Actinobacteria bacterium]|nr:hypothetical protein [Actinomycetota bacterium]
MVNLIKLNDFLRKVYSSSETLGLDGFFNPEEVLRDVKGKKGFIQEVAGRDSIASLSRFLYGKQDFEFVLISAAFSPTEFGDLNAIQKAMLIAENIARLKGLKVYFAAFKSVSLWSEIVSADALQVSINYGFYSPCIGCHMYLHLLRARAASILGVKDIVSGERIYHKGKIKINQSPQALDAYQEVFSSKGFALHFPLKELDDEDTILSLLPVRWEEGKEQLICYFTGSSKIDITQEKFISNKLNNYLKEYLIPKGKILLDRLISPEDF